MGSLKVCYVSPTYFAPESLVGGGERYAEELSRAMSELATVKLVTFGPRAVRDHLRPGYERVVLKSWTSNPMVPFSPRLFLELRGADVVHCFQYHVLPTFFASIVGRLLGSRVFVTDFGGGAWTPSYHVDQSRWLTAHLPISQYAARSLPGRNKRHVVIYGGVDLEHYPMRRAFVHDGSVVFLGRILPHKGIHFLIKGLPDGMNLHVIGSVRDEAYLEHLQELAAGKRVMFHLGLSDAEVLPYLQNAMALVHPTPVDAQGSAGANELLGLALIEAMACGCPVIASDAASLPEIVRHGITGILVPPNSSAAISAALNELTVNSDLWIQLARGARRQVALRFTWKRVADQCLRIYQGDDAGQTTGEDGNDPRKVARRRSPQSPPRPPRDRKVDRAYCGAS